VDSGTGLQQTAGLLDQREITLTKDHQQALRKMLALPYASPMHEIEETPGAGTGGLVTIRKHYVINIPASVFPPNSTCWGDLIRAPVSANVAHFKHLLLMMSAIVSDASFGTSGHAAIDPNAAQVQGIPGGHAAAPGGVPGAPGGGGGGGGRGAQQQGGGGGRGGGGRGRGRGGGPGQAGGIAGLGLHGVDTRGDVPDANGLMFEVNGRRYAKVIPAVEECMNESGERVMLYRLNFFVFDPQFHLGRAIERTLERNAALYAQRAPDQQYLQFGQIRSTQEYMEQVIIPYLEQGMQHRFVPPEMRLALRSRIEEMRDETRLLRQGLRLGDDHHPANPNHVFNKALAFCLYLDDVDPQQRNPANYYNLGGAEERIAARAREADRLNPEDVALDDEDMDDPDLVVPDDVPLGMDYDDEMDRITRRLGLDSDEEEGGGEDAMDLEDDARPRGAAAVDAQADRLAEEQLREQMRLDGEDYELQKTINQTVTHLRLMSDETFESFNDPEHVYRISSNLFGRRLLNLPLIEKIRELTRDGAGRLADPARATATTFDLSDALAQDKRNKEIGLKDDEMHPRYVEGGVEGMTPVTVLKNRREALTKLASTLVDPPQIKPEHVEKVSAFRELYRAMQMQGMLYRREQHERQAEADVMRLLSDAANLSYRTQVSGESDSGLVYGGFLPETLTQRLSQNDFFKFAAQHVLMQLRYKNLRDLVRLQNKRFPSVDEKEKAIFEFRIKASEEFWDIFLHSERLPPPLIQARDWFKKLPNIQQWGEMLDLCRDLSSFGNFVLDYLSLYNSVFRGASNQQAFMLVTVCHWSSFQYDWGIKPNLLLMGDGSKGKSYLFEVAEVCSCPGTMASWSHQTDRAHSTGTSFSDQTTCMHEAPLTYVQQDKFGNSTLSDPVLKDRLARQRSGTKYFSKDEAGNRVTREDLVMIMGTILMATNDNAPPDNSPLMQRFIVMAVNDFKRPEFDLADQSAPLKDLLKVSDNNRKIHGAQLFNFYMLVVHKLVMVGVLPPLSTDATEILLPQILERHRRMTNMKSEGPRRRKQICDIIENVAYAGIVRDTLFSMLARRHSQKTESVVEDEDGTSTSTRLAWQPFHPSILVREALPRLYVTDEHVVYGLSLLDFLVTAGSAHKVLDTVASKINIPVHHGEPFVLGKMRFRITPNDLLAMQGLDGAFGGGGRLAVSRFRGGRMTKRRGVQQTSMTVAEETREYDDSGSGQGIGYTQPTSFIDARYAVYTADSWSILYSNVARASAQPAPPPNQVVRMFNQLATLMYAAHPVVLKPALIADEPASSSSSSAAASTAMRLPAGAAVFAQLAAQPRVPPTTALMMPSLRLDPPSSDLMQESSTASDRERAIRDARARAQQQNQDRMQLARGPEDSNTVVMGASGDSLGFFPPPRPPGPYAKYDGMQAPMSSEHFVAHADDSYVWEVQMDKPTEDVPVVQMYTDPFDRNRSRVVVAVLLEYVKNEGHKDSLHEAIRHVLSNNTLSQPRRFITAQPATFDPQTSAAEFDVEPDAYKDTFEPRVLPQFCAVIDVKPTRRSLFTFFPSLGTDESDAFISSSLGMQVADDRASTLSSYFSDQPGIRFKEGVSINEYFATRHFQRHCLSPNGSDWHKKPLYYIPENQTRILRLACDSAGKMPKARIRFIEHYPQDSIKRMLRESMAREMYHKMDEEEEQAFAEHLPDVEAVLVECEKITHMGETTDLDAASKRVLTTSDPKERERIFQDALSETVSEFGQIYQGLQSAYQATLQEQSKDKKKKLEDHLKILNKKRAEKRAQKGAPSAASPSLLALSSTAAPEPEGEEEAVIPRGMLDIVSGGDKMLVDVQGAETRDAIASLFRMPLGGGGARGAVEKKRPHEHAFGPPPSSSELGQLAGGGGERDVFAEEMARASKRARTDSHPLDGTADTAL
jgi:hypothetical protein